MENENFIFFNPEELEENYSEISSKCLIFTLLEEFMALKCVHLDSELRTKLENAIEKDWRVTYVRQ